MLEMWVFLTFKHTTVEPSLEECILNTPTSLQRPYHMYIMRNTCLTPTTPEANTHIRSDFVTPGYKDKGSYILLGHRTLVFSEAIPQSKFHA